MKKDYKRTLIVLMSVVAIMGTTISVYATNTNFANQTKKARQAVKNENTIIGKISAIDATNVTIQVATRKEIQKPENGVKVNPPEMSVNGANGNSLTTPIVGDSLQNGTDQFKKPNMDELFNLTGETKTINIATANFGNKKAINNVGVTDNTNTKKTNWEKKTYADYKVGDYVSIQATDNTYTVAKKVNQANFGRMRGFKGNGMNRTNRFNGTNKTNRGNQAIQSNQTQPIIN